jgi:hypothetical protein
VRGKETVLSRTPPLNTRVAKVYPQLSDNPMDAVLEKVNPLFGYWLSDRADMTVVSRKPGGNS